MLAKEFPDTLYKSSAPSERLDEHGVAYDPKFCADAEKPFYASGKKAGQWKAKRGADESVYDEWYAAQLVNVVPPAPAPIDPAAAFATPPPPPPPPAPPLYTDDDMPKNTGEFMVWVAEQTAAGRLSQPLVTAAYSAAGVQLQDLFDDDSATVAVKLARVYGLLIKGMTP